VLSVVIPVTVALLLFIPQTGKLGDLDVSFLPGLNAILNTSTFVCLWLGYYFIKNKKNNYHITMMIAAFVLSSLFLICYVIYHYQAEATKYGSVDWDKYVYYFLLLTHILLAIVIVPLVLLSIYFGLTKQYQKHTRIAKWTFPIWVYVAGSGVIVYLMISPFYK
jgi:putative membrane protein